MISLAAEWTPLVVRTDKVKNRMALENTDLQEQLQQAPPQAPTAADVDASKVAADSASAQQLADALTPAKSSPTPFGSWEYKEKPADLNLPQPEAPYNPSAPAPGSLGYHLMKAFSTPAAKEPGGGVKALFSGVTDALLGKPLNEPWKAATTDDTTQPTTVPPAGPSRAQRVINNLGASFGDLAAATEGGPEGGGIMGAARVARAGAQRSREQLNDQRMMAASNAQMLHEQALVHKMGEDEINSSIATSTKQMENLTTPVPGAPTDAAGKTIATDKTSDELNQMIKSGELNPTEETVFATGRVSTGKDANGVPQFRTTYTVVKPAKEVELSPENAKYLNENLGLTGTEAYSTDPEKPQRLPGVQVNQLFQQANNARVTKRAFEVKEAQEDETIRKAQTSKDAETIFKNPVVMNAINGHMSSPDDPFAVVKAYDAIMNNPKLRDDPSMPRNFSEAYIQAAGGTAVWDKKVEEYSKAQAKSTDLRQETLDKAVAGVGVEGHTSDVIAAANSVINDRSVPEDNALKIQARKALSVAQNVRQLEIELEGAKTTSREMAKATAGRGPESDKVGPDYLATLPKSRQSLITGFMHGNVPISPYALERTDKGQALLADILQTMPDFDSAKGETWFKNYNEYVGTGPTAKARVNYNTALEHLQDVYDNSGLAGFDPASKMYQERKAALAIVANEVGKAVKTGVVSEGEADKIYASLGGWTPAFRRERAAEVAKLLKQKIDEFQHAFNDSLPSAFIPSHTLISPRAQASYDHIEGGGQAPQTPQSQPSPSTGPTGGTHPMVSQDGKTNIWLLNNQWVTADGKPYRP